MWAAQHKDRPKERLATNRFQAVRSISIKRTRTETDFARTYREIGRDGIRETRSHMLDN